MNDLIKRSEAITEIKEYANNHTFNSFYKGMLKACEILAQLPSADRPQGEWIDYRPYNIPLFDCSICGYHAKKMSNYCPNCGARLRPRLQGKHFDSIIIDESAMKGADDE